MVQNNSFGGASDCPCTAVPIFQQEICLGPILPHALANSSCVPKNYGTNCSMHHVDFFTECKGSNERSIPEYCYAKWCFVNKTKCFASKHPHFNHMIAPGYISNEIDVAVSSTTCGDSNFIDFVPTVNFKGHTIDTIIPSINFPFHYLERDNGTRVPPESEEYFENKGTWKGIIIDFLELVKKNSEIKEFKLRPRSGRAKVSSEDQNAKSIRDVYTGLADIAAGVFLAATDDFQYSSFTLPIAHPKFHFYELKSKGFSASRVLISFKKTFDPFHPELWLAMLVVLISVSILSVCFAAGRGDHGHWHHGLHDAHWKKSRRKRRIELSIQIYFDSCLNSFRQYFGNAAEVDPQSSLSHKILAFGFGFFILILGSSYTANLASFLTTQSINYSKFDSLEMMIEQKIRICVPHFLEKVVHTISKDGWVMISDFPYTVAAYEALKDKKCDVFFAADYALQTELGCKPDLVRLDERLVKPPLILSAVFPVKAQLAGGISSIIFKALQKVDSDFEKIYFQYVSESICFDSSNSLTHEELTYNDLLFPNVLLLACVLIAILLKLMKESRLNLFPSYIKTLSPETCENSQMGDDTGNSLNSSEGDTNEYLDLLECKYRLDLIGHDISRADIQLTRRLQKLNDPSQI